MRIDSNSDKNFCFQEIDMPFTTESTCQSFVNNLFEASAGQNVGLTGYVCVGDGVDNKVGQYCISFLNNNDLIRLLLGHMLW